MLEKSLNTDLIGQARIRRDEEIEKFFGTAPRWKGQTLLVEDKFGEFVELKRTKARRTHQSISGHWENHLKAYFGSLRLDDVTESEWLRYVQEKRKIAPDRKFFNDRKYLSMFLNWLHREGFIKRIPRLENVDPERAAGKIFSDEEVQKILENAEGDLKFQILMAITMGMRKGEILTLEWRQIDFQRNSIYLPAAKTKIRKERTFGISEACVGELTSRYENKTDEWVFPNWRTDGKPVGANGNQKSWTACKKKVGVTGRFHDLRHTFLTKAFKKSVNPALICHYAGLSLEEAQRTYLHFTVDDTRVVSELVTF